MAKYLVKQVKSTTASLFATLGYIRNQAREGLCADHVLIACDSKALVNMELRNVFTEAQVDALKHDGPLLIGGLHIRLMVLQDQVEHHDGVVIAVIPSAKMLEKIDAIQGITDTYVLEGFADEQKHWLQK